jgi:hypothetical protein
MRKLIQRLRMQRRQQRYTKTWVWQCDGMDRAMKRLVQEARKGAHGA